LPISPIPDANSAFKILYLSPLWIKKAPGLGYNPFILAIIFSAVSLHCILLSDLSILNAYVASLCFCCLNSILSSNISSMLSSIFSAANRESFSEVISALSLFVIFIL
jgi:hypothetical protein